MRDKFSKLRGKIAAAGMTREELADAINRAAKRAPYGSQKTEITAHMISERMTGRVPWLLQDALLLCDVLEIPHHEIAAYFVDKRTDPQSSIKAGKPKRTYKVEGRPTM